MNQFHPNLLKRLTWKDCRDCAALRRSYEGASLTQASQRIDPLPLEIAQFRAHDLASIFAEGIDQPGARRIRWIEQCDRNGDSRVEGARDQGRARAFVMRGNRVDNADAEARRDQGTDRRAQIGLRNNAARDARLREDRIDAIVEWAPRGEGNERLVGEIGRT